MSFLTQKVLLEARSPLVQCLRFRAKLNLKRPKKPHFERQKFLDVAEPYYINPKKHLPLAELCDKSVKYFQEDKNEENRFQRILANELRQKFETSKLIAFCHLNPMSSDDQLRAYITFKKQNMLMKNYGKKTVEMALENSKFEVILQFYQSRNMLILSEEAEIKKLLKTLRKFPQLVLLAGIYEGRLLSKEDLIKYSQIPNLQTAQAGLVQTLNSIGQNIVLQLQTHQNNFVAQLNERIKQLESEKKD